MGSLDDYKRVGEQRVLLPNGHNKLRESLGIVQFLGVGTIVSVDGGILETPLFDIEGTQLSGIEVGLHRSLEEWDEFCQDTAAKGLAPLKIDPVAYRRDWYRTL
ncbi:MAG TPA: hypothetical protein VK674_06570 [Candidatus Limnocylindria bacterium]|nr:hypothetical protein [Candidatus Limnocylindria bacterium]